MRRDFIKPYFPPATRFETLKWLQATRQLGLLKELCTQRQRPLACCKQNHIVFEHFFSTQFSMLLHEFCEASIHVLPGELAVHGELAYPPSTCSVGLLGSLSVPLVPPPFFAERPLCRRAPGGPGGIFPTDIAFRYILDGTFPF